MAGSRRREAARARLRAGHDEPDSQTAERALKSVGDSVDRRDPPSGDEANRIAADELRRMRADKRAKTFVSSPRT